LSLLTIRKSDADFSAVRWLVKAVDKGIEPLSVITVKDKKGYTTDGKRMHIAEGIGIKDGVYRVMKNTGREVELEKCLIKPPLYDKVIPESGRLSEPLEITSEWCRDKDVREGNIVLRFARGSPAEVKVNLAHLLEALDIKVACADAFYFQWLKEGAYRTLVVSYKFLHGLRKAVLAGIGG
jgi:hypothetical protein